MPLDGPIVRKTRAEVPPRQPVTRDGKLFAGLYALYCGLVVIAAAGFLIAPVIHRVMHTLHWDES